MATHDGLEALAVSELDIEHPAVTLDETEGVKLALVALVVEGSEVAPVDLEALPDGPALGMHNDLSNREPQPAAVSFPGAGRDTAIEVLKAMGPVFPRNA